jgi:hypothetical protein
VSGSAGARLCALAARGPLRARIEVDAVRETVVDRNVVGELAGADDDVVVIGSHHDGPWSSAVEDASGIALVLAQAAYWASLPRAERPTPRLPADAGHMCGAPARAFLAAHRAELARVVLEVHLEHAAAGSPSATGLAPTVCPRLVVHGPPAAARGRRALGDRAEPRPPFVLRPPCSAIPHRRRPFHLGVAGAS